MTELPKNGNNYSWVEYRLLVLDKLDSIEEDVSTLATEQIQIRLDIKGLKVRAALWGGITGGVLGLVGTILNIIFGG